MGLTDDLEAETKAIFRAAWTERDGTVVPDPSSVQLGNDAVNLDAVVLYADIAASTKLVDNYNKEFAAEIYKSYLHCAAKVIRSEGGEITAYDGDRIMAVFVGNSKNSSAGRTALKINFARVNIVQPEIKAQYPTSTFVLEHGVGVDSSKVFVARTGIRGANDLVWVGKAANHAAKLASWAPGYPSCITQEVHARLRDEVKETKGKAMWTAILWPDMNRVVYRSTWTWRP